jgi:arylsulfatase
MKTILANYFLALSFVLAWATPLYTQVLPKPEPPFKGKIGRTVKDFTPDFPKGVEAPKGAPNILLIMTDDVGFGASSTFGVRFRRPLFSSLPTRAFATTPTIRPRFAHLHAPL